MKITKENREEVSRAWKVMSGFAEKVGDTIEGTCISVSTDDKKSRLDICNVCDSFIQSTKQCKECGCFMEVKASLKAMKCPLKKWNV